MISNIVVLNLKNNYINLAIISLLNEIAADFENINFHFHYNLNKVDNADIIFTEMVAGEFFLCHEALNKKINKTTIFIFHSQKNNISKSALPNCINSSIFLDNQDDVISIKNKILKNIRLSKDKNMSEPKIDKIHKCLNCKFKTATSFQLKILYATSMGFDTTDISEELGINYKTIFSHKKNIMNKFHITNKHEFNEFANLLKKKK